MPDTKNEIWTVRFQMKDVHMQHWMPGQRFFATYDEAYLFYLRLLEMITEANTGAKSRVFKMVDFPECCKLYDNGMKDADDLYHLLTKG